MRRVHALAFLLSCSALGCPADQSVVTGTDSESESDASTSMSAATTSTATTIDPQTTSGPATSSTTDDATTSVRTGTTTGSASSSSSTTTTGVAGPCAIDLLFVVDNSGSMMEEQAALFSALPDFIDDLGDADLHAMVVDVDADPFELCRDTCESNPECFDAESCVSPAFECFVPCSVCGDAGFTCPAPEPPAACDITLGAGVVHPMGDGASNQDCDFSSGARYIDNSRQNFANTLLCAAQVGISSTASNELVMSAMVEAVTAGSDAEDCNEGFLRDDALLVVVFVTDENDDTDDSPGNPTFWKLQLETAKGGSDEDIVVLGIFGDTDQPDAVCMGDPKSGGAEDSPRLRQFVDAFDEQGVIGSVCAGSFAPYFNETAEVIGTVCGGG